MSPSERATLERRVAQLAEQHNGMVPARVTQSMEAHHHLHPPTGKHGLLAMGSTLVLVNDRRESVEVSVTNHTSTNNCNDACRVLININQQCCAACHLIYYYIFFNTII